MILKWQKLLKLFSSTPDLGLSERASLRVFFRRSLWAFVIYFSPRVTNIILYLFFLGLLPFWLWFVGFASLLALFVNDIRYLDNIDRIQSFGFDGRWYLVDKDNARMDVEPCGEVFANGYFVAVSFKPVNHDAAAITNNSCPRRLSFVCGAWNLSHTDFHALRMCLISA